MAYIIMTYIVMAYIVMAYIVMAYIGMALTISHLAVFNGFVPTWHSDPGPLEAQLSCGTDVVIARRLSYHDRLCRYLPVPRNRVRWSRNYIGHNYIGHHYILPPVPTTEFAGAITM